MKGTPQNQQPLQGPDRGKKSSKWTKFLTRGFELLRTVIIIAMIGFAVHIFVLTLFVVSGESMEPNFHDKEYMLVDKLSYYVEQPQRGDVVVFEYPGEPDKKFIKRIIGLPGERVEIKDFGVFINSKKLKEPYLPDSIMTPTETSQPSIVKTVGKDEYFVMGDNRVNSSDSRIWGLLPKQYIIGKAFVTIYPFYLIKYIGVPKYQFVQ